MVDQDILDAMKSTRNDPSTATLDSITHILEFIKQISDEDDDIKRKLKNMNIAVQIIIIDKEAKFWVKVQDGKVDCGVGEIDEPSFKFSAKFEIAVMLLSYKITSYDAYMEGHIIVEGNLQDAMIFQELVELGTKAYLNLVEED
ncbi:MAG: SCP2 sterol-binding domain-containing protein [Promethearchaeota archaeon]